MPMLVYVWHIDAGPWNTEWEIYSSLNFCFLPRNFAKQLEAARFWWRKESEQSKDQMELWLSILLDHSKSSKHMSRNQLVLHPIFTKMRRLISEERASLQNEFPLLPFHNALTELSINATAYACLKMVADQAATFTELRTTFLHERSNFLHEVAANPPTRELYSHNIDKHLLRHLTSVLLNDL